MRGSFELRRLLVSLALLSALATAPGNTEEPAAELLGQIEAVDRSEGVLLDLLEHGERLERWLSGSERSTALFTENAEVGLFADPTAEADSAAAEALADLGIRRSTLTSTRSRQPLVGSEQRPWSSIWNRFETPYLVDLHLDDGDFLGQRTDEYRTRATLLIRDRRSVARIRLTIDWQRSEEDVWRVERMEPAEDALLLEAEQPLFEDVLDRALPPPEAAAARRSLHEEKVRAKLEDPASFVPDHPAFHAISHDRHPAVSVVDLDDDGWDDLYVMARWGRNRFYRNRGNGTFEEISERLGLHVDSHTSCALFADFDNDGDKDVFLCRTLERSQLLRNEKGRFVDASDRVDGPLPKHVASAAAADFDRDGLLDLYVATYAKKLTLGLGVEGAVTVDPSLPAPGETELVELLAKERNNVDSAGPPNVLLRNLGDSRFTPVTRETGLLLWRHTYQAAWADYDRDGDPDLYLANDYGPNNLFENRGDGTFTDVTAATGTADRGFGMGIAWGDYDGDGWLDLYVSNMFSRAGSRITRKIGLLEEVFAKMARGNTLLRNRGGERFEVVSGGGPGKLPVEETGWSWGGQFADLDNDGWLDLAVLNGYYSAPDVITKLPVDT